MSRVKLAVIGNGMVGHRFIEDLLEKADKDQFDITVFCEEPRIACLLISPTTPPKSSRWFAKAFTKNRA